MTIYTKAHQDQESWNQDLSARQVVDVSGLIPKSYDYIALGYTGSNITSVTYKIGGSGGTTVATLTLVYSGDNITSITRT